MSSPPSIFDIAFNAPPPHPNTIFPGLTGSRVAPPQPSPASHGPPRLPSPRLFRDFFSDMNNRGHGRQATAPRLPLFRERTELDPAQLAGAIARTSRAVEGVQQAFRTRRTDSGREVVDLTVSPPETGSDAAGSHSRGGADSDYLSTTTHPYDSARRRSQARGVGTLNEPIFGYQPVVTPGSDSPEEDWSDSQALARAAAIRAARVERARRARPATHRHYHLPRPRNLEQEEREAVRRQRENHAAWLRTQGRIQQLQGQRPSRSPSPASSLTSTPSEASSIDSRPTTSSSDMSRSNTSRHIRATRSSSSPIEAVDLTAVDSNSAVAATLAKQRADAIAAQRPDTATENGRTTLTAYKCPVCMDTPVNATTTICGHLFCHQCIIETLQWSLKNREEQGVGARKKNGMCPVCRKLLAIKDTSVGSGRTLIPLELKFMTKKRKADDDPKGKGKAKEDDAGKENRGRNKRVKREKRESTDEQLWGSYMNDDVA